MRFTHSFWIQTPSESMTAVASATPGTSRRGRYFSSAQHWKTISATPAIAEQHGAPPQAGTAAMASAGSKNGAAVIARPASPPTATSVPTIGIARVRSVPCWSAHQAISRAAVGNVGKR